MKLKLEQVEFMEKLFLEKLNQAFDWFYDLKLKPPLIIYILVQLLGGLLFLFGKDHLCRAKAGGTSLL